MRNIPVITRYLLVINVMAFLLCLGYGTEGYGAAEGYRLNNVLGLHFFLAPDFHAYQLLTYMFMHGGWEHLFFNMFALWMFGCVVERVWGPRKFLLYYLACGVGAGLFQELAQMVQFALIASDQIPGLRLSSLLEVARNSGQVLNLWTTVGASGAIYAILLAFGMIFPEERIFIFPLPIPVKAKWFVMFYAGLELFLAFMQSGDGVAHIAHLGGMVFGFFMIRYWKKHPSAGYGRTNGQQVFDQLQSFWARRRQQAGNKRTAGGPTGNPDWDYNARKQAEQAEIDRILDKIRRSGYDSLTREEKQKLFEQSKK